ncbi:NEL-type E3 ubiquitin ligase domain-containing protein [Pseudomonas sp. SIMBA_077]
MNRAFEGFYLRTPFNPDTEKLIRHFITKVVNWPASTTIELRDGSTWGNVVQRWGASALKSPCVIVKTEGGYQRYRLQGEEYVLEPGSDLLLSTALFKSLTNDQRQRLGFAMIDQTADFNATLAKLASAERAESARILGMQPIRPEFKPPLRISDGRLGYPLCGLDTDNISRSMRRRVLDIHPRLDDEQIQDYLASITESGLDPLAYLRERKRQRKLLRQVLQSWIDESPTEITTSRQLSNYAGSRHQAAEMIQRSWHKNTTFMPWVNPEHVSSLNLEGLRVGSLPVMPSGFDFSHITHLNINNMECGESVNGFLQHFNNLTLLQMDKNRIRSLPSQLQNMPGLRQLSLANNFLYVTPADNALLASLRNLEVLNLNGNLLGPMLDLSSLPYLRRVYLRRTAIQDWPSGLVFRPMLEIADLRENRLIDIPELVYQAPASVTHNISLSGNPLMATSRLRLARFIAQGGSSMGINSEGLISEAAALEFWTTGITHHERTRREGMWLDLKSDPSSEDFFFLLSRLTVTADAQSVRQDLSRRVWEMIEAASQNQTLRRDLLDIAAAPRSCTDSVALTFSSLEVATYLARLTANGAAQEAELVNFAKGLFRLDQVEKIAAQACADRLANSGRAADEVEVHLAYRIGLAQALDLPGQPQHMTFKVIADVSQADLDKARVQVELAEKTSKVSQFISRTEFWREHLNRTFSSEFAQLTFPYFEQLGELLRRSPEMTSERYLSRVNDIRTAMDVATDAWCLTKTVAVLPAPLPGGGHD